jgi:hypothetical protein
MTICVSGIWQNPEIMPPLTDSAKNGAMQKKQKKKYPQIRKLGNFLIWVIITNNNPAIF